jgi:choline dehydrogenase-like flavoprotein
MNNSDKKYDVVIVGGGWAGATMAKVLGEAGKKVLILEAGNPLESKNREEYMQTFFEAMAKVPSSPYPQNYNAPRPSVLDIKPITAEKTDPAESPIESIKKNGYFIEKGPLPFGSTNERLAGGTSWHWLGTCLRLVPNDFKLKDKYKVGVNWPMTYDELSSYYDDAEYFIGVAGAKEQQDGIHGITFTEGYNYPMKPIPPTVLDQAFSKALDGLPLDENIIKVTGTPAGRNGPSNRHWKTGKVYSNGRRLCQGNTNCTPICPIQAKYDATITLSEALNTGNVDIMYKTVAYEVMMDETTKEINGIKYKQYETKTGPKTASGTATGTKYVVAAHAIESAKLFLMSNSQMSNGIANSSLQMGKNLMDHPMMVSWGLMPKKTFPFRGPLATSGIETLKDGKYREDRAAYRIEIGNEGWNWPTDAPYTETNNYIDSGVIGSELINNIQTDFTRQFRIGFLIEQDPEESCYIVPSEEETDNLGIPRPEIHYDLSKYTRAGFEKAREATKFIFDKLGATDYTYTTKEDIAKHFKASMFEYNDQTYNFFGAGHIMGTHRMGDCPDDSVTNADMKSWDHDNLYIVGCGSFPTGATSNPTLTLVALALKATDALIKDLEE